MKFHNLKFSVSIRICVGVDTGAIAGKSKVILVNEAQFQGRDNDGDEKKLLQSLFKVERDLTPGDNIASNLGLEFLAAGRNRDCIQS